MLSLYYYNKVEIASVFHIRVRRMWKTHRFLHHPRRSRACPARALSAAARYCFTHPVSPHTVGRGLDPSAARRGRRPTIFRSPPCRGRACPARNLPAACRQSSTAHPPIICARQPRHPNIHLAQTSPSNFVEKIKKTCKNLLTKVILLAIIIKLSREPSPRRQPLEPLPTACTPFFEENFFKKLSESLLTNERI